MEFLASILPWTQIVLSVLLIITILLQQTGAGLGGIFGGNDEGAGFHSRRGAEKTLFHITIVLAILFALSALVHLFI
ncbi:MAG: preprotein translocase subunit SecG [Parcubacteria group bacterium]|nr:preprotein translocase subunit SecG [Parcubacteria group bacterium]